MKKTKCLIVIYLIFATFSFMSCELEEEEVNEGVITEFTSSTLTISDSDSFLQDKNLKLSGKTLYLAKVNTNDYETDSGKVSKSAYLTTKEGFAANILPNFNLSFDIEEENSQNQTNRKKHYVVSDAIKELNKEFGQYVYNNSSASSRFRSALRSATAKHESALTVGNTKSIFVDSGNGYEECDSTLQATGTYCNVWVIDECFGEEANGSKITSELAQSIATKFDSMYPLITKVYGVESDLLYVLSFEDGNQNKTAQNMGTFKDEDGELINDTGTKINIVICNLEEGYVGYFAPKDYYYSDVQTGNNEVDSSNVGKYFYLDSSAINSSFDDSILTLAHEFQHMINFNMKQIIQNQDVDTPFNEMLSMVCEDMMQSYFGVENDDSPINRLPLFNKNYYKFGLKEWHDDTSINISYANSYAFGAWLCREFGGAEFVNKVMTSSSANMDSILSVTGLSENELLKKYVQALVFNSTEFEHPTFNKNAAEKMESAKYKFPMKAIDLWNLQKMLPNSYKNKSSNEKFDGPIYLSADNSGNETIKAHGFTLHKIGTVESGKTSVTLTLSSVPTSNIKYYVLIQ